MAIVATLAALLVPAMPVGTSRAALEGYATQTAALLKRDRDFSRALRRAVATELDVDRRIVRSGATGASVTLPADVAMSATIASECRGAEAGAAIVFLPSGMSCGGAITLARPGMSLQIRVNWLTGGVEIVS